MGRSGYSYDCENMAMWRGQVASAIRGKRGQAFFRDLIAALDALPEKRLISEEIKNDQGCVCALGALGAKKGLDLETLDPYDYEGLGGSFNIAHQLAQEVMFENDEGNAWGRESPEQRWERMRAWAVKQLRPSQQHNEGLSK